MAQIYQEGHGVEQDYKTAIKWYTLSAEQGFAPASSILGYYYRNGLLGVEQDYKRAANINCCAKKISWIY